MRFSEAMGHKIVSLASAETVGVIDELIVDPASHRVIALGLGKNKSASVLRWERIEAFGADAVTVADESTLANHDAQTSDLSGKDHTFLGKRVLATIGDELGAVQDVEFDPSSGVLSTIVLPGGEIAASDLVGIGSYAVVVTAGQTHQPA